MIFNSRRSPVMARRGMVATSQPLASVAGLRMLMEGGNAVDGAVAAVATLNVVEPASTGVGGDVFALVWLAKEKKVQALNASGRAPGAASAEELRRQGLTHIPYDSPRAITVPGAVHGWCTLLERYGSMSVSQVLQPAIEYAEEGYPVSPINAQQWAHAAPKLLARPSGRELLPGGKGPRAGQVIHLPELARTLRTIAEGGAEAFYQGPLARKIADCVQGEGGWLSTEDLASHTSTWERPVSTDYRGVRCWECPPNGQGIIALLALNLAEGCDLGGMGLQSVDTYHHLIEVVRLAMADGYHYIADPACTPVPIEEMLSKEYAARRRDLINSSRAMERVRYGNLLVCADTVYLTCVDGEGNACSFINSVYQGFGSGLVVPGTGIALHNRGASFSLEPDHPNILRPGKRPFHTIIPAMATRDGELWRSFGVMGTTQQAQGHLQVLVNMVDFALDPQAALDALRFSVRPDGAIALEEGVPRSVLQGLKARGHRASVMKGHDSLVFGGGQVIQRDAASGVLTGGSDPRKDGCAVGW